MSRAVVFALFASSALIAGAAQAQQICCVPQAAPRTDGLRGYAEPQYQPRPQYDQYAPPQYAERPPSTGLKGYVGVEYGKSRTNPGTPSPRIESWTGEGAVVGQYGGLGIQGDLKVANFNTQGSGDDSTTFSPTVHLFQRTAQGLVGGWAGWSHTDGANLYGIGLEGQAYLGSATLYGSAGYGKVDAATDSNLWAARLEGRYFITENFRLNAQVGLVRASASGAHTTVRTVGAGVEFQPDVLPFSVQAGYTHADASNSTAEADTLRIGLRWNFGGQTLAERDRLGPSLVNVTDQFQSN